MEEQKKILNYKIDFSVGDTSSILNVKSIMEIINDGLIKWQLFVDEDRPNHFSTGKGELFYLIKAKTNSNTVSISSREK